VRISHAVVVDRANLIPRCCYPGEELVAVARVRIDRGRSAPDGSTIDRPRELDLPLAVAETHLKRHVHVRAVGRQGWLGEVKPRECLAGRAVEGYVAALARPVAGELVGHERNVVDHDPGHAEAPNAIDRLHE